MRQLFIIIALLGCASLNLLAASPTVPKEFSTDLQPAMLHVRYRLNMFGGKVDTEGRYDKKWGNNDRRER